MADKNAFLIIAVAVASAGAIIIYVIWNLLNQAIYKATITTKQLGFGSVNFTATTTGFTLPISYLWDFGFQGATETTNVPGAVFVYLQSGTYTVTLTATDINGHQAIAATSITVNISIL